MRVVISCLSSFLAGLLLWSTVFPMPVNAEPGQVIDRQLEAAILEEDWVKVANLLDVDNALPPVARLVKGHAYLALNRNNESLCLFLSVSSEDDLRKWEEWAQDFVRKNPQVAIAHYFRGDALARLKQQEAALKSFDQVLELHPNHPLALDAQGVTYAAIGQGDHALVNFHRATQTNSSFADAYASLGSWYIQSSEAAEEALRVFNRALEISPDFVLALNGRGSSRTVLGELDQAEGDLQKARMASEGCLSALSDIVDLNVTVLSRAASDAVSQTLTRVAKVKPGMSLELTDHRLSQLSRAEVATLKGVEKTYLGINKLAEKLPFDTFEMKYGLKFDGRLSPFVEGGAKNVVFSRGNTLENKQFQQQMLSRLDQRFPDIPPAKVSLIESLRFGGGQFRNLTRPGGVSTEEIGQARTDRGNWNVFTLYGLLYKVQSEK